MLLFLSTFFSIWSLSYKPVDYLRLKVFIGHLKRLAMLIKLVTFLQRKICVRFKHYNCYLACKTQIYIQNLFTQLK